MLHIYSLVLLFFLGLTSCEDDDLDIEKSIAQNREILITSETVSSNFVGNGVQWGGYDMVSTWLGTETLSDQDWEKMFSRIDFLRPPFLRIITSPSWSYDNNGVYDENTKTASLYKMYRSPLVNGGICMMGILPILVKIGL